MSIFDKWQWIERNWHYIIEEATKLDLVFVGGTALNLVIFDNYRASENIDLYDPNASGLTSNHEQECIEKLAERLKKKGFNVKNIGERMFLIGPNIKVEIFNDSTSFTKIEKNKIKGTIVNTFDLDAYCKMKTTALLCRTNYDARDLVDLFYLVKLKGTQLKFPSKECGVIENHFEERLKQIKNTKKEDLMIFQTLKQIDKLGFSEFEKFKVDVYEWLSKFR